MADLVALVRSTDRVSRSDGISAALAHAVAGHDRVDDGGIRVVEHTHGALSLIRIDTTPRAREQGAAASSFAAFQRFVAECVGADLGRSGDQVVLQMGPVTWRTVWTCALPGLSVMSTSLRACTFLLGDIELDDVAPTQFLVTGTLGPVRSWDRRVRQMEAHETVSIDTRSGVVSSQQSDRVRTPPPMHEESDAAARDRLAERIESVLERVIRPDSDWTLPLSGGYDSRALLLLAPRTLPTLTWGSAASARDKMSDSVVAADLAASVGAPHEFIELDGQAADPHMVIDRFVHASEGRVDHIDGYTDGMELWRRLRGAGRRILRGDEAFGWVARTSDRGVRRSIGALTADDLTDSALVTMAGDLDDLWRIERRPGWSRAQYRDLAYRLFRAPSVLAPLNQVKSSFVDVTCPLLDPLVVEAGIAMTDPQRTDKRVFRSMVEQRSPKVRFAQRAALPTRRFVTQPSARDALIERLSAGGVELFDAELFELVRGTLLASPAGEPRRGESGAQRIRRAARSLLPERVVSRAARATLEGPTGLAPDRVLLRMCLAEEAVRRLREVADAGTAHRSGLAGP